MFRAIQLADQIIDLLTPHLHWSMGNLQQTMGWPVGISTVFMKNLRKNLRIVQADCERVYPDICAMATVTQYALASPAHQYVFGKAGKHKIHLSDVFIYVVWLDT